MIKVRAVDVREGDWLVTTDGFTAKKVTYARCEVSGLVRIAFGQSGEFPINARVGEEFDKLEVSE